jgi:hypothetical protein
VKTTQEAQDCLAALFRCVERWEGYYRLAFFVNTMEKIAATNVFVFVPFLIPILVLALFRKVTLSYSSGFGIGNPPEYEEEAAWTNWIHENVI